MQKEGRKKGNMKANAGRLWEQAQTGDTANTSQEAPRQERGRNKRQDERKPQNSQSSGHHLPRSIPFTSNPAPANVPRNAMEYVPKTCVPATHVEDPAVSDSWLHSGPASVVVASV